MDIRQAMKTAVPAGRPDTSERASGHRAVHRVAVGVLTALVAAGYSVFSYMFYYTFRTTSYDLEIFDQAVRSYAHFRPGVSIIKGVHNGFGPNFSVLGDHFSPILAALAPLYWIHDSPVTLLVAQAALFALAIPSLWIFTRRAFGGGAKATIAAYLVAIAYGLSWPLAAAAAFDFHEAAFAPVLTAIALERFQAGRLRSALIALALLLLVKEDMGLLVAGIGVSLAVSRPGIVRRKWLVAIGLVVVGVVYTAFATYVLIPAFGGRADYYWAYSSLGNNVPQVIGHMIAHPRSSLQVLFTPRVKLDTMLWLVGAFGFLPLLSPIALAALPLLLERMLGSKFPNWWVTQYQYNSYLLVILVCAAVDGAARLDRWATLAWRQVTGKNPRSQRAVAGAGAESGSPAAERLPGTVAGDQAAADELTTAGDRVSVSENPAVGDPAAGDRTAPDGQATRDGQAARHPAGVRGPAGARVLSGRGAGTVALACAVAMFAIGLYTVPKFALGAAFSRSFYHRTAWMNAAAAADAKVPSGVTVQATNYLGPQLASRDTVLLWDGDGKHAPLRPPWVVAQVRQRQFTFSTVRQQRQNVQQLEHSGYRVVFDRDGYVVLHRVGQQGAAKTAKGGAG
jgi:uncharacterized membrane protein